MGEVCDVQNGYAFDSSHFTSSKIGVPLIRIRDILRGYSETYTDEKYDQSYIVRKGDFLIGMDGDFNVGEWKSEDALLNQRVCRLVPSNKVNSRFIYYYLPQVLKDINDKTTYATVKHLSSKQVKQILVPAISLSEQGEIVAYLDKEFALIDALREKATLQLQAAKDLFQSALKQLLTPKQGWEEKKLCDVSDYYNGLTYKPTDVNYKGWIVLRSSNIQNNKLDLSDLVRVNIPIKDKLKVKKGDIIMCSRNGSKSLIGKVALISENREDLTFGTFMMIFKSQISNYLFYYFLSEQFKIQIWKGEATMINQITRYMLDEVTIPLPSLSEQEEIVRKLDALSEKCRQLEENYRQTITLCNDLKQTLLRQVFE